MHSFLLLDRRSPTSSSYTVLFKRPLMPLNGGKASDEGLGDAPPNDRWSRREGFSVLANRKSQLSRLPLNTTRLRRKRNRTRVKSGEPPTHRPDLRVRLSISASPTRRPSRSTCVLPKLCLPWATHHLPSLHRSFFSPPPSANPLEFPVGRDVCSLKPLQTSLSLKAIPSSPLLFTGTPYLPHLPPSSSSCLRSCTT